MGRTSSPGRGGRSGRARGGRGRGGKGRGRGSGGRKGSGSKSSSPSSSSSATPRRRASRRANGDAPSTATSPAGDADKPSSPSAVIDTEPDAKASSPRRPPQVKHANDVGESMNSPPASSPAAEVAPSAPAELTAEPPKKRIGRPPGSKTKPMITESSLKKSTRSGVIGRARKAKGSTSAASVSSAGKKRKVSRSKSPVRKSASGSAKKASSGASGKGQSRTEENYFPTESLACDKVDAATITAELGVVEEKAGKKDDAAAIKAGTKGPLTSTNASAAESPKKSSESPAAVAQQTPPDAAVAGGSGPYNALVAAAANGNKEAAAAMRVAEAITAASRAKERAVAAKMESDIADSSGTTDLEAAAKRAVVHLVAPGGVATTPLPAFAMAGKEVGMQTAAVAVSMIQPPFFAGMTHQEAAATAAAAQARLERMKLLKMKKKQRASSPKSRTSPAAAASAKKTLPCASSPTPNQTATPSAPKVSSVAAVAAPSAHTKMSAGKAPSIAEATAKAPSIAIAADSTTWPPYTVLLPRSATSPAGVPARSGADPPVTAKVNSDKAPKLVQAPKKKRKYKKRAKKVDVGQGGDKSKKKEDANKEPSKEESKGAKEPSESTSTSATKKPRKKRGKAKTSPSPFSVEGEAGDQAKDDPDYDPRKQVDPAMLARLESCHCNVMRKAMETDEVRREAEKQLHDCHLRLKREVAEEMRATRKKNTQESGKAKMSSESLARAQMESAADVIEQAKAQAKAFVAEIEERGRRKFVRSLPNPVGEGAAKDEVATKKDAEEHAIGDGVVEQVSTEVPIARDSQKLSECSVKLAGLFKLAESSSKPTESSLNDEGAAAKSTMEGGTHGVENSIENMPSLSVPSVSTIAATPHNSADSVSVADSLPKPPRRNDRSDLALAEGAHSLPPALKEGQAAMSPCPAVAGAGCGGSIAPENLGSVGAFEVKKSSEQSGECPQPPRSRWGCSTAKRMLESIQNQEQILRKKKDAVLGASSDVSPPAPKQVRVGFAVPSALNEVVKRAAGIVAEELRSSSWNNFEFLASGHDGCPIRENTHSGGLDTNIAMGDASANQIEEDNIEKRTGNDDFAESDRNGRFERQASLYNAASAIERFAIDTILPSLLSAGVGEGGGSVKESCSIRAFVATLLSLREILTLNADAIYCGGKKQGTHRAPHCNSPHGNRSTETSFEVRIRHRNEAEERAFRARLLATSTILSALHRLEMNSRETIMAEFARSTWGYDNADEEFASCLERADGRSHCATPDGRIMGREENVAWRVSFNRFRDSHPLIRAQERRDAYRRYRYRQTVDSLQQSRNGVASRPPLNERIVIPSATACAVYMVERLPPSTLVPQSIEKEMNNEKERAALKKHELRRDKLLWQQKARTESARR